MRQYVGIILVKDDGSVLSQHRDNKPGILGPNTWSVVGGKKEDDDESLENAAVRELKEETNYVIDPEILEILATDVYQTERGVDVQRTIFCARYDGTQPINTNEGQEIRFISVPELNSLNFYTGHRRFLRQASEKVFGNSIERK